MQLFVGTHVFCTSYGMQHPCSTLPPFSFTKPSKDEGGDCIGGSDGAEYHRLPSADSRRRGRDFSSAPLTTKFSIATGTSAEFSANVNKVGRSKMFKVPLAGHFRTFQKSPGFSTPSEGTIESKGSSGRLLTLSISSAWFFEIAKNSRVYRFIKQSRARALFVAFPVHLRISCPSLARNAISILERVSHATLYSGIHPLSKGDQGCLAKSPKACTPGGIQPPSCLRPSVLRSVPQRCRCTSHPPGSCFVKLDLRVACRRFVIPAGYILAKVPPTPVIPRSMNSRDDISRHTHRQTIP